MQTFTLLTIAILTAVVSQSSVSAQLLDSKEVTFPSGNLTLRGYIHKPSGNGTFPAIILNHGSEAVLQQLRQ